MSVLRKKANLPQRPPPPPEPRSFLLPIAGVVIAAFALFVVPLVTAEPVAAEAAAPATPTVETVTLTLRTTPEGVTVKRGDEVLGTTPCDVELPASEAVTLQLTKDGFLAREHEVTPEVGMEPLDLSLDALPFVLALRGVPEGAEVHVGETTPTDVTNVALGTTLTAPVQVRVSARGFRDFVTEVSADAFANEDARRFHAVDVALERRAASRPRATETPMVEGLPTNPF